MTRSSPSEAAADLRHRALSRWDNEGGALSRTAASPVREAQPTAATDAELVHLRVRVIALETIVIALLASGPPRQSVLAGEMADLIRPRDGSVPHPLTLEAAHLIDALIQRSRHFAGDATEHTAGS